MDEQLYVVTYSRKSDRRVFRIDSIRASEGDIQRIVQAEVRLIGEQGTDVSATYRKSNHE